MNQNAQNNITAKIQEDISPTRNLSGIHLKIVFGIAILWTLFQLWYASPFPFWFNFGMFKGLPARAIHLGFALTLTFLIFPVVRGKKISVFDILISIVAAFCCLYIYFFYDDLVNRGGILLVKEIFGFKVPVELIIGATGILILLEATRRAIGLPLVIIAICFLLFSYFGKYAPDIISHGGLSVKRLVGFQWFDQEAIFGIPIGVSVDFIFLFVLFGALLETAGGGKYFLDLAFAMVGKMRGGPAKAAILGSGMTGMISGSSIATAATMSKVAMPEMRRYKYADSLATASIAAGGTLGILIPPSVILVIYGLLTEQSIGKLFMAGFIPGVIGIIFYTLAVKYVVTRDASLGPAGEPTGWRDRLLALKDVWSTLGLFIFVIYFLNRKLDFFVFLPSKSKLYKSSCLF